MNFCKYFKSPATELPMEAKQAAALTDASYQKIYKDSVQDNLMRWKERTINSINASVNCGKYNTSISIYKTLDFNEIETFGLEDFCRWLRGFGYKVTTDEMSIHINWEAFR